jgi:glycosyltransferase involved in cell wall biosynthesis
LAEKITPMKKVPQLSVFFPAYNEEKNIKKTLLQAIKVLDEIAKKWEIIVVDDGSTDKTAEIAKQLSQKYKNIRLIDHKKNKGYGAALKTGMAKARYSLVCYTDSDGQFDFSEIKNFLPKIKNHDLIIGFRKKRIDKLYRRILAKILWLANLILFKIDIKDIDCGFKLFKKRIIDKIGSLKTESAITETEFIVRAQRLGFKIAQVGVNHHSRIGGGQTGGKFRVIFKGGIEGLELWYFLLKERCLNN